MRRQPAELREKKKNEINGEEREVRQVLHEWAKKENINSNSKVKSALFVARENAIQVWGRQSQDKLKKKRAFIHTYKCRKAAYAQEEDIRRGKSEGALGGKKNVLLW